MATNFGNTSATYSRWDVADANVKRASRVQAPASGNITGWWLYCECASAGPDLWKALCYADSSDPTTLLGTSAEANIGAGSSKGWRYVAQSTLFAVVSGTYYWLGFINRYGRMYYGRAAGGTGVYNADTYTDGAAASFGAHTEMTTPETLLIYAVIEPANSAPNAPTITSPATGANAVAAQTNRVYHAFSDPDALDTQSASELRWSVSGAASWTTITNATPLEQTDIPAGTFTAGVDYDIQVRTYDAQGLVGPYCSSILLHAVAAPAGPTITDPTVDQAITTDTYAVVWSIANQTSAEARRVADSAGSPDTGTVYETVAIASTTLRTAALTFDVDGRTEHVQVRREYPGGVWSSWATCRVSVAKVVPITPIVTVVADSADGYISVTAAHTAVTAATNYFAGPSFEVDGNADGRSDHLGEAHTTTNAPTFTRPGALTGARGSYSQRTQVTGQAGDSNESALWSVDMTAVGTFAAGDPVSVSALVKGAMTGCDLRFFISGYDAAGNALETFTSDPITVTATAARLSYTAALTHASTSRISAGLMATGIDSGDTVDFYADDLIVTKLAAFAGYFDGETLADGAVYAWTGTTDASTSTRTPLVLAYEQIYRWAPSDGLDPIRVKDNNPPGTEFRDYLVAAQVEYYYMVTVISTDWTASGSAWTA